MSHVLTEQDSEVIRRCIRVVLDSGALYAEEIATRVGVPVQTLKHLAEALPRLPLEIAAWEELTGISFSDLAAAVHNSLVEVAFGINIDEDMLQSKFGVSRREVQAVLSKWDADK